MLYRVLFNTVLKLLSIIRHMLPVVETHQIFVYEYMISKILSILQKRKFSPFFLLSALGLKLFKS